MKTENAKSTSSVRTACLLILLLTTFAVGGCSTYDNQSIHALQPVSLKGSQTRQFWTAVRPVSTLPSAHYKLGRYYQKRGKHKLAADEFIKAIKLDNRFIAAYNGLGMAYDALLDCDKADKAYSLALSYGPNIAYILNNYGCSRILCDDFDLAIELLARAATLDGKSTKIANNLRLAEARMLYENPAISLAPQEQKILQEQALPPVQTSPLVAWHEPLDVNNRKKTDNNSLQQTTIVQSPLDDVQSQDPVPTLVDQKKHLVRQPAQKKTNDRVLRGVEISNGNGVTGLAKRSAKFFKSQGFSVKRITNAPNFGYQTSVILYREGCFKLANEIAKILPGSQDVEKVTDLGRPSIGVRLVLGGDLKAMRFSEEKGSPVLLGQVEEDNALSEIAL